MTRTWGRRRIILLTLAAFVFGGGAGGYAYHRHAQQSSRVKAANCLRQIALAGMMYASTQPATTQPAQGEAAWNLLKEGGHVVLLRHAATTPGTGDPPNFRLGDRSTQRNLSDAGREQAKQTGQDFQKHGVRVDRVLSSQYCRCLDTAGLAFGRTKEEPALNSALEDAAERKKQTEAARKLITTTPGSDNVVLVTHSTNVYELTGIEVEKGEMLVLKPAPSEKGGFKVVGRIGGK